MTGRKGRGYQKSVWRVKSQRVKEASEQVARNRWCWVWVGFTWLLELYVVLIVFPNLRQRAKIGNAKQKFFCFCDFVLNHDEMHKPQHSPGCLRFGEQPRIWPSSF